MRLINLLLIMVMSGLIFSVRAQGMGDAKLSNALVNIDQVLKLKGLRLIDGNQGVDKVLVSDSIGIGTWKFLGDIQGKEVSDLFVPSSAWEVKEQSAFCYGNTVQFSAIFRNKVGIPFDLNLNFPLSAFVVASSRLSTFSWIQYMGLNNITEISDPSYRTYSFILSGTELRLVSSSSNLLLSRNCEILVSGVFLTGN